MSKRAFDLLFGLFALILALPLMALSALMVYLEDGPPVLFHVVHALIDRLVRRRPQAAARRHAQRRPAAAVDLVLEIEDAEPGVS